MTTAELDRAIERLKVMPKDQRDDILMLPKSELETMLLLISELDARKEES